MPPAASQLALAARFLKAGRPDDAIVPLREAAAMQPGNATILHDLGLAYLEAGRLAESVGAFQSAVACNPRATDSWFRMGIALERQGDSGSAIVAYDRTTELLPSHTEAWFRAGALVFTLGHKTEAAGCFRRAAATGPKTKFGRLGAARALLAEDRDAEAEKVLRQILALDRNNAIALDLLGNVLAESGRFQEARETFAHAIAASPAMAGSYYDLVRCQRLTPDDAGLLARMEAALAAPELAAEHRLRIHLALGKAANDLGDYAGAMRHFDAAYEARRAQRPFDATQFDSEIDRMIAQFSPNFLARAAKLGHAEAKPVLIVGMPRSGTTLVEQIISSHPDVAAGGELNFWNERGAAWNAAGDTASEADFLDAAAADYLALLRAIGPRAARVTDKMPFNFLWAGLIHAAFPSATIIHCRRAPIDTALSIHQTSFNPHLAFPTGGPELVAYFRSYERLMAHWRDVLMQERFVEIDYAELTRAPEPAIRRLIAACGLPWDDSCLRPERNLRVVKTPSKWQARQPIYRNAIDNWRRYEPYLGDLRPLLA